MVESIKYFESGLEYLKGVGPQRAKLFATELDIHNIGQLLQFYPFRYEDRPVFTKIKSINYDHEDAVQILGKLIYIEVQNTSAVERLVCGFVDNEGGEAEIVFFRGVKFLLSRLKTDQKYVLYGKPSFFREKLQFSHPELDIYSPDQTLHSFVPIYHGSEKLRKQFVDSKAISKIISQVLPTALNYVQENIPQEILLKYQLISRKEALHYIHLPQSKEQLVNARRRLKWEELFYVQIKILHEKTNRNTNQGFVFAKTEVLNTFYKHHLQFQLTEAQKRVLKEIFLDCRSGKQMNRLLQGDVGSGKTIVAFICILLAIDNGKQACMVAPTEILSEQHFISFTEMAEPLGLKVDILTGSTTKAQRKKKLADLENGETNILISTHAVLEDNVIFKELGICVIDEQHRFGVEQRSKLWKKNKTLAPHILVMTATPIPRTLAMTLYGDLEISQIDELPQGRKPIITVHRGEAQRNTVFAFIRGEIQKSRQIYIVYPLIEENEKLDLLDLKEGFESINRAFPEYQIGIVHGKMKPKDKDFEMQRFKRNESQILVSTTVIEVGVNVPNATVMIIENAERFGLAQLHQLRGRVGRGADQSYCILMTKSKINYVSRQRIETLVRTQNGFEIADVDLKLRGPGDMLGTQQSGMLDLMIADLAQDSDYLKEARNEALAILEKDPHLTAHENLPIFIQIKHGKPERNNWGKIS